MNYFGYIYKTTNKLNNMQYIGKKTSTIFNPDYYGSGVLIQKAIKKYGKENFITEILEWCKDNDELNDKEKYYIELYNAYHSNNFYNIAKGGEGGNTYVGKSKEEMDIIKRKISVANLGERNGNKGQYKGPLNSMYGKKHSFETRQKISESLKKSKCNRSHKWTKNMNDKRNETITRYIKLWEIEDNKTHEIRRNFTNKINWIKTFYPETFDSITKLEKLQLFREGILMKTDVTIKVTLIDIQNTPNEELNIYKKYHSDYKEFIYNRMLLRMKNKRKAKKSNKV